MDFRTSENLPGVISLSLLMKEEQRLTVELCHPFAWSVYPNVVVELELLSLFLHTPR